MFRRNLPLAAVVVLALAACSDDPFPTTPESQDSELVQPAPAQSIVDGSEGEGNPKFFWLKPVKDNTDFPGIADPTVEPVVQVCLLNGALDGCVAGPPLAEFSLDAGPDQDRLKIDDKDHFFTHWRMGSYEPVTGEEYRIRVFIPIGGQADSDGDGKDDGEFGYVDVTTLAQRDVASYDGELLAISDKGAFKIAFRIEEGALEDQFCDFDGDTDVESCSVGFEDPNDGEPTVVQVNTPPDAPAPNEPVAIITINDAVFTDANGDVLDNVVLTAELEIAPPSLLLPGNSSDPGVEIAYFVEVNTFPDDVFIGGAGVEVIVCQSGVALDAKGITSSLHQQLVLYKVSDSGVTQRLPTEFDFSGACEPTTASLGAPAGLFKQGLSRLAELFTPKPLVARRLHGGLNTVVRRDATSDAAFSTFGATLGPDADFSVADVPVTGTVGSPTAMEVQLRTPPQGDPLTPVSVDFLLGGDDVVGTVISGPNAGATVTTVDNGDGSYSLSYTPTASGLDQIAITLTTLDGDGPDPIVGSPFESCVDCLTLGFEGGAFPGGTSGDGFWNVTDGVGISNTAVGGAAQLAPGDLSGGALPSAPAGSYYLWYGQPTSGNFDNGAINQGSFTTQSATIPAGVGLSFQYWFEVESVDVHLFDLMTVDVLDLTAGTTTQVLRLNPTVDVNGAPFEPYTSGGYNLPPVWKTAFVSLSAFAGHEIQVRFNFGSGDTLYNYFRGWALDDVGLTPPPPAAFRLAPDGLVRTRVRCEGVGCDPRAGKPPVTRSDATEITGRP